MTFTEGTVRPDALSAVAGRLEVAVHLPWYRSLPLSCLEAVQVTVDGRRAATASVAVPGFTGSVGDAAGSDVWWDLRDPLTVTTDAEVTAGDTSAVEVGLAVRIPYLLVAPGVPLVQRVAVQVEATVR